MGMESGMHQSMQAVEIHKHASNEDAQSCKHLQLAACQSYTLQNISMINPYVSAMRHH